MWHFVEIVLLAFLASCLRTLSAYHCEPNAIILIQIGIASFHFAVKYNYIRIRSCYSGGITGHACQIGWYSTSLNIWGRRNRHSSKKG